MKSIYILLTKSDTVLSRIIRFVTDDTYTHAAISFDENLKTLYSSSRKNGWTLLPAGPCREYLQRGYYKRHPRIPCAVYELQVSDDAYEKAKREVAEIMAESYKYHYNIIGLLLCRLNIPYHREHYFFCSQFVSEVLNRSEAIILPKDTSLMRPGDYAELPELMCRFNGSISDVAALGRLAFA